jgi:TPR repeat protein
MLLAGQGRDEEAEPWLRKAATAGNRFGMEGLARLLAQQGRAEEAEPWLRKAATAGDHGSEVAAQAQQAPRNLRQ